MLQELFTNPLGIISFVIALLIGFTVHEASHAYVADKLGDNTARLLGRLSLNPLAHLDLLGTIFLVFAGFGWGKPVPIDLRKLKNPLRDEVLIALAGPASNFLLAIVLGLLFRLLSPFLSPALNLLWLLIIILNLRLGIFNLLPIPPLDGSKILQLFMPLEKYLRLQQIGMLALFLFLLAGGNLLGQIINIPSNYFFHLLTNISGI